MLSCTVKFEFNAAKRLMDLPGPCQRLHGYRHGVEITLASGKNEGIVADFYAVRTTFQQWLDAHFEHQVILNARDKKLGDAIASVTGQTIYYLPHDPTAEMIALHVKELICPQLFPELTCLRVRIYDTENQWVEA